MERRNRLSARGLFRRSPISSASQNRGGIQPSNSSGENPQTPQITSQLSPRQQHHHQHGAVIPQSTTPMRECACGRGLACQGMSQAFRLLGDPRSYYVELPRYRENPPAYKYVFRNNLRSAYLRHLKKSSPRLKESDFDSTQRRYVALHHFHPTVVKAFHENPLTSAQKHKVPISITEHELRDLNMEINESDRILSVTGVPTGGYYFVPSYPQTNAHRDLKELIRIEREKREAKKRELSPPPPEEKTETESDDTPDGDGETNSTVQYKLISAKEYFESRRASVQKELESTPSNEENEGEPITPEKSTLPEQQQPEEEKQESTTEVSSPLGQPVVAQQHISKIEKIVDDVDDDTPFADDGDAAVGSSTPTKDDKPADDETPVALPETKAEESLGPDANEADKEKDSTPADDNIDSGVGGDVIATTGNDLVENDEGLPDEKPADDDKMVADETTVEESGKPEEEEVIEESGKEKEEEEADDHSSDEGEEGREHDYGDNHNHDDRDSTGLAETTEDDDGGEFDILVADSTASDFDSLWADDSKDDQDILGPPKTPTAEDEEESSLEKSTPVITESEKEDVDEFEVEDVPSTSAKATATIPSRESDHPWDTPKYRRHTSKREMTKMRSSGPAAFIDPTVLTITPSPSEDKETPEEPPELPAETTEAAESPLHDEASSSEPPPPADLALAPTPSEDKERETSEEPSKSTAEELVEMEPVKSPPQDVVPTDETAISPDQTSVAYEDETKNSVDEPTESPAERDEKETIESSPQDEVPTSEPATPLDPTSVAPPPSEQQKKETLDEPSEDQSKETLEEPSESPPEPIAKEATEVDVVRIENESAKAPPQDVVASSESTTPANEPPVAPQPAPSGDQHAETIETTSESLAAPVKKETMEQKAEPVEKETTESPRQDDVASSEPAASVDKNVATSPSTPAKTEVADENALSESVGSSSEDRPSEVVSKDESTEELIPKGLDESPGPKTVDVTVKKTTESPSKLDQDSSSKSSTGTSSKDVMIPAKTHEQEEKPDEKTVPKPPSEGERTSSSMKDEEEKEELLSTVPVPTTDEKSNEQAPDPIGKSPVEVKPMKKAEVSTSRAELKSAPTTTGEIELHQPLPGTDPTMRIQVHNELIAWESKRRASLSHELELNREEWKVAREILRSGVEEVEYAERLVLGFAKAGTIFADSLQAVHDDTLIDDSGKTVSNSFLQNRLQQKRQVQEYSIGKAEVERVGEGESALLNSLIKSQADLATTLRESSQHMEEFILSEIKDLRTTVQSRAREIETVGDGILGELKRSETEVKNIWDVFDAMVTGDLMEYSTHGSVHGSFHGASGHGGSLHASLGTSGSVHGFSVDNSSPIISSLNSPLVKNTFRQLGSVEDGWIIETHYKTAVLYQKTLFDVAAKELESLFTKIISLEEIRFRKLHQIMLAFVPRQERLYTTLPRQMKDVLDDLVGLRIDEESLQAVIDESIKDRSHNHLKKDTSHRSAIMNRSRIKSVKDSPEDEVPEIENIFGNPFDSSTVLVSKILELKPGGLGGMVNQNWKFVLALVTSSGSFHIFELSQEVKWAGRTPAEAFKSLYPPKKFDSQSAWIRKDNIVRRLTPTQTLDLTICSLTIPNMRKKQLEIVEEKGGQRAHMGAKARLLKAVNAGAQRVMRCTLRLSSIAEASEWVALLEKTKKDIRSKQSSQKQRGSGSRFRF